MVGNIDVERTGLGMREELIAIRRYLHERPELGLEEIETANFIQDRLENLGVESKRDGTAIVALIRGGKKGGTVALRADMDALPLEEENESPFRSRNPGVMHACGHDAHTTILLGVARLFAERRDELSGNIKLLFQPAEETVGGAQTMVEAGCLEDPRVDRVYGLHVMPYLPVGVIEVKKGTLNGSSATLHVVVRGKSGHGAYPETGVDAVLIASHVALALNELVSRYVSPLAQAVLSIGTIHGGRASNIIASEVKMEAILRTSDDCVRDTIIDRAESLVGGVSAAFGGSGELSVEFGYAALVNHDDETERIARVAGSLASGVSVRWKEKPSMGVEDFSFFIKEVPGAFYHLGCGHGDGTGNAPLHSPLFDLNEDCLPLGVALQAAIALDALNELATGN